jgi:hypothetical protein
VTANTEQHVVDDPHQTDTAESNSLAIDNDAKADMDNFDVGAVCEEEEDAEDAPLGDEDGESHNVCGAGYTPLTTVGSLTQQPQSENRDQSRGTVLSFMRSTRDPTRLLKIAFNSTSTGTIQPNTLCTATPSTSQSFTPYPTPLSTPQHTSQSASQSTTSVIATP